MRTSPRWAVPGPCSAPRKRPVTGLVRCASGGAASLVTRTGKAASVHRRGGAGLTRCDGPRKVAEPAGKPGSVVDSHSSRPCIAAGLQQPTRMRRGPRHRLPLVWLTRAAWRGKWRSRPVSRVLSWTVIPLGPASLQGSSNLPGGVAGHDIASLFGLAPDGVCRAGRLPGSRCALTAPFHPCRPAGAVLGGIFLLHFPSARAAQALPGIAPCGARTFLGIPKDDATVWPAPPRAVSHEARLSRRRRAPCAGRR